MCAKRRLAVAAVVLTLVVPGMLAGRSAYASPRGSYYHPGDTVAVEVQGTRLMVGHKTLATLARGEQFKVEKVQGVWVEATVQVNGKPVTGWVWERQVSLRERDGKAVAQRPVRRYSYQPAPSPVYRSYRVYRRSVPIWDLQKTNPERYEY